MIKWLALLIFGWRRTPSRYAVKFAEYITAALKDHGVAGYDKLPHACLLSLSQLAYTRAMKGSDEAPRFIYFVRELDLVVVEVEAAFRGSVRDERIRSLLAWHDFAPPSRAAEA